jgi:uncharacterized damage-inducible protein DinB
MTGLFRPGNHESSHGSHTALDTLDWLSEEAFAGDPDQSLLANLKDLREEDWSALPAGGGRSIAEILEHVAWAKWMYQDYAFGPATLRGDVPPLVPPDGARARPKGELLDFLAEGQERWLASIRALSDDSELTRERLTNWGERLPTVTLIRIMIGHDFYHAGEINHLRCLLHGTDRWPYD